MERSPSHAPAPQRIASAARAGLAWLAPCLALAAALHAGPELVRQRYLQQGLWSLAAEIALEALWASLPAAAAGAALAALLAFASRALARWLGSRAALGLAAASALALVAVGLSARRALPAAPDSLPSILLVSVDTLRADHLGAYGYARPTSPAIDRLAAEGLLFRHAVAQAQWTLPSMASLHSGLYPSQHAAQRADIRLAPAVLTVAEVLRDAGYRTLAVVAHFFVGSLYGFRQGMQVFDESQVLGHDAVTSEGVTRTAARVVEELGEFPFFLWVHYFDPHFAYVRHPEFDFAGRTYMSHVGFSELLSEVAKLQRRGEASPDHPYLRDLRATYDEEIAYTDLWIGRLVEQVRSASAGRPLVIVLTADHGEGFLDRGVQVGHARGLYEELIHVPLIFAGDIDPGLRGRQVARTVELASIPRTLLGLAGIEEPHFPGEDLLSLAAGPRPVFSEGSFAWAASRGRRAVILDGWKLIHDLDADSRELYHLAADPDERRDLWGDPGAEAARRRLEAELEAFSDAPASGGHRIELDAAEREMLRELGYAEEEDALSGSGPAPAGPAPD